MHNTYDHPVMQERARLWHAGTGPIFEPGHFQEDPEKLIEPDCLQRCIYNHLIKSEKANLYNIIIARVVEHICDINKQSNTFPVEM